MKTLGNMVLVFPFWILMQIMRQLVRRNHPWKLIRFSVRDYAENMSVLSMLLSVVCWLVVVAGACAVMALRCAF